MSEAARSSGDAAAAVAAAQEAVDCSDESGSTADRAVARAALVAACPDPVTFDSETRRAPYLLEAVPVGTAFRERFEAARFLALARIELDRRRGRHALHLLAARVRRRGLLGLEARLERDLSHCAIGWRGSLRRIVRAHLSRGLSDAPLSVEGRLTDCVAPGQ